MRTDDSQFLNARKRMIEFFHNEISRYVLPDIERLTNEIGPNQKDPGGCTIPLALTLFSLIDLFAFLIRTDQKTDKRDTEGNYRYFLAESGYFPEHYSHDWERILKLFRHGLTHQYFPKASGIKRAGSCKPLVYEQNSIPVLNVDVLSKDVVDSINLIRAYITENKHRDLILRMNSRLDSLAKDDYQQRAQLD